MLKYTTQIELPEKVRGKDARIILTDSFLFPHHKQIMLRKDEIERLTIPGDHEIARLESFADKALSYFEDIHDKVWDDPKTTLEGRMLSIESTQKKLNAYLNTWRILDINAKGIKLDFVVISVTAKTAKTFSDYVWKTSSHKKI